MLKSRFALTILLMMAALLGGGWILVSKQEVGGADYRVLTEAPFVGHMAPDFTLPTADSHSYTLSNHNGQPVLLNFWATWCTPCRVEMPHLQAASEKYNGRITILGINEGEAPALIDQFATDLGITYPLLLDDQRSVTNRYGIRSLPTTLFISADGIVSEVILGAINEAVLEERIEKLLKAGG